MAIKIKKLQIARHIIQLIMFFLMSGLYAMTFSEVKTVYKMIIGGNFNFIQAFPSLIEFVAVMLITIIMGRWFCGWVCAFGAYNDLIYFISKKVFKRKFKVDEKTDSILKYAKYVILVFIIIISWTLGSNILESTSPWDAFGQVSDLSSVFSSLLIGLILLILITIGAAFIERFFCRYLCPLGAIFSIISKIGIVKINKPKAECGPCRACTMNCSMGLNLYKVDGVKGGDCINCLKCTDVCPRGNANVNVFGKDLDAKLTGTVAMATFLGVYGVTNFAGNAVSKSGIVANSNTITSNASSASDSSQKYKDGTYTGSGEGFKGGTTKVSVTVSGGKITDIKTVSNEDTPKFYEKAEGTVIKSIISKQSTSVDAVSGATFSSKGIMSAVENALSGAGSSSESKTDSNSNTANSASTYKDGTYTGSGEGFKGGTTKVSVTVSGGKITDIKTISNEDTPKFYERVEGTIMNSIISKQSTSVDVVSGATYSSKGIMSAVANALSGAGTSSEAKSDSNSNTASSTSAYKDGTYTGSGTGFKGGTTKVSVTVSGGKITEVKTISNEDTPKFYERVEGTIINSIISKQSTSVDVVSGATYSSKGIMSAVENALSGAK